MRPKLYILISTIDNRIANLENIILDYDEKVCYVISHQVTQPLQDSLSPFINELNNRKDVRYSRLTNRGVAKNRNNTLQFIQPASISLILDDDIILLPNTFNTVLKSFQEYPEMDIITFKILDKKKNDYKRYPVDKQRHSIQTLTSIGTTEMAFQNNFILNNKILFDEQFGPGATDYPIGEDFIFATDLYALDAKMFFIPIAIIIHPDDSTGSKLDKRTLYGRGAMFARVFGHKAFIINFLFSIKKFMIYRNEISFFAYLYLLTKGSINYLKNDSKEISS